MDRADRAGLAGLAITTVIVLDAPVSQDEKDAYAIARRFFDAKEFERVSFILDEHKSAQSRFLCYYSQYLVCYRYPPHPNLHFGLGSRKASVECIL